jgi:V/A-type H+-transporting ATPase subunit D
MSAKINPTRINLLRLKSELKVAKRGHKLLKDKRDGLMREFMGRIREVRELRGRLNPELISAFTSYVSAAAIMNPKKLDNAFAYSSGTAGVTTTVRNVMSVPIPRFTLDDASAAVKFPYGYLESYGNLDAAVTRLRGLYTDLIRLAELESAVERLAREIEPSSALPFASMSKPVMRSYQRCV